MRYKPPGTHRPSRFRPQFHWELLVCGVAGHELIGLDAAELRPEDALFARDIDGRRWYRCVRCDSWLPLPPPERPSREYPPDREAFGLWYQKRWAEYLTFVATTALLPLEAYELTRKLSPFKIVAIVVNVAIVVYLLFAKRLFGLRGGGEAEEGERQRDVGWEALERTAPPVTAQPYAAAGRSARPGVPQEQ